MTGEYIQLETIKIDWFWIITLFFGGHGYMYFEAQASSTAQNPAIVSIIGSFEIPVNYCINILVFGAEFRIESLVGSIIVMVSIIISIWYSEGRENDENSNKSSKI